MVGTITFLKQEGERVKKGDEVDSYKVDNITLYFHKA